MVVNSLQCWLENSLDTEIDAGKLESDNVTIASLIVAICKKYHLLDMEMESCLHTATTLEHKLRILQSYLSRFGKIDERTLVCVKCGNIELLKTILKQMFQELGFKSSYKYIKGKIKHGFTDINKKIDKGKEIDGILEQQRASKVSNGHQKSSFLTYCEMRPTNFVFNELLEQRRALEEQYLVQRSKYNTIKNAEFQCLRKLFHKMYDVGMTLAEKCFQYKSCYGVEVPDNIVSEWISLLQNGKNIYELPLYLTTEEIKSDDLIKIDKNSEKNIENLNKQQYLCSQGAFRDPKTRVKANFITGIDQILAFLKTLTPKNELNVNYLPVRVILQTNMVTADREKFLKELKKKLAKTKIEIIEPNSCFEQTLAKIMVTDVVSKIEEIDDGACEVVEEEQKIENPSNLTVKRKSLIKRATSAPLKSRKSVTISDHDIFGKNILIINKVTRACQTPMGWVSVPSSNATAYLQLKSSVLNEDQRFNELPLKMKIDFVMEILRDLASSKDVKGFVLIDFPKTLEEIHCFESTVKGQASPLMKYGFYQSEANHRKYEKFESIFTHFIRMKNYSELYNGLCFDEINLDEFKKIEAFYSKVAAYHTLEYYNICQEDLFSEICEIFEEKKSNTELASNKIDSSSLEIVIRTQISTEKADVELQVDLTDFETNNEQNAVSNVDQYQSKNLILSKFFIEETLEKLNQLQNIYKESLTKPLTTRSNILRDSFCLKRYIEATFNMNIGLEIDENPILKTFENKFNELEIFYRKDDDGKLYLYSLVDDLFNELTSAITEKQQRNLFLLKSIRQDLTVKNMGNVLTNCSKWLLYHEVQRFIEAMKFIIEQFSNLLCQEILMAVPEIHCPENVILEQKPSESGTDSSNKSRKSVLKPIDEETESMTTEKGSLRSENSFNDITNEISVHGQASKTSIKSSQSSIVSNEVVSPEESLFYYKSDLSSTLLALQKQIQTTIDNYSSLIHDLTQQITSSMDLNRSLSIIPPSKKPRKRSSLKTKRRPSSDSASISSKLSKKSAKPSRKRKSTLHTIPSVDSKSISSMDEKKSKKKRPSIASNSTFILTDATFELKNKLKNCINEECEITQNAFKKIERTLNSDLEALLMDNAMLLEHTENRIREKQKAEIDQVENLVRKLSEGIENTWKSVEICKCNGHFNVHGALFLSPTPSLESLSPDDRLSNQLSDIKFLISEFQTANSPSYRMSYQKLNETLQTSLVKLYFKGSQLCSTMQAIPTLLSQLKQASDNAFDIVDWRDLIVNLIEIRQPTLQELLEMREKFEANAAVNTFKWVSVGNYCQTKLWFEGVYATEVARQLKGIFFELYKKSERSFWYETFLMAFCKGGSAVEGFHMAMQVFAGKRLNDSQELEEKYLQVIYDKERLQEMIKQEMEDLSRNICCKVLYSDEFTFDHDPPFLNKFRSASLIISKCTSIMASESFECIEQRCQIPKTPVERYLQSRKLHSCGCPKKEIDYENILSFDKNFNHEEFCINRKIVLQMLEKTFPWHLEVKSDGIDLIEGAKEILDDICVPPGIPLHRFYEHEFIQHWIITTGLTFKKLSSQ